MSVCVCVCPLQPEYKCTMNATPHQLLGPCPGPVDTEPTIPFTKVTLVWQDLRCVMQLSLAYHVMQAHRQTHGHTRIGTHT